MSTFWLCGDEKYLMDTFDFSVTDGTNIPVVTLQTGSSRTAMYPGVYREPRVRTYSDKIATPTGWNVPKNITFSALLYGTSMDEIYAKFSKIQSLLDRAQIFSSPFSRGTGVVFAEQLNDAQEFTFWDVISGVLTDVDMNLPGTDWIGAIVQLVVAPYSRGTPQVLAYGSTITNGVNGKLYIPNVLGDAPGILEFRLFDVSTGGQFITWVGVGRRWYPQMAATDMTPIYAESASITTSQAWQQILAQASAAGKHQTGLFDVWGMFNDASPLVGQPTTVNTVLDSLAGALTPGVWTYQPVGYNGGGQFGPAGAAGTATVPGVSTLPVNILDTDNFADLSKWSGPVISTNPFTGGSMTATVSGNVMTVTGTCTTSTFGQGYEHYVLPDSSTKQLSAQITFQAVANGPTTGLTAHNVFWMQLASGEFYIVRFREDLAYWDFAQLTTPDVPASGTLLGTIPSLASGTHTLEIIMDTSHSSGIISLYVDKTLAAFGITATNAMPIAIGMSCISQNSGAMTNKYSSLSIADGLQAHAIGGASAETVTTFVAGSGSTGTRLYITSPSGTQRYVDLAGALTYTHTNPIAGTLGALPTPTVFPAQIRSRLGAGAAPVRYQPGGVVRTKRGNGVDEMVKLGTLTLPPGSKGEYRDLDGWTLAIDGKSGAANANTLTCKGLWLFPADEEGAGGITAKALGLAQTCEWRIGWNRFGRPYAMLFATSGGAFLGYADVSGGLSIMPGDNTFMVLVQKDDGAGNLLADTTNLKFQLGAEWTPRAHFEQTMIPVT